MRYGKQYLGISTMFNVYTFSSEKGIMVPIEYTLRDCSPKRKRYRFMRDCFSKW